MTSPNTTKVNAGDVKTQAELHRTTSTQISRDLDTTVQEIQALLGKSRSKLTEALHSKSVEWAEAVKKVVLDDLDDMAEYIETAATGQQTVDADASDEIGSIDVTNFLTGV